MKETMNLLRSLDAIYDSISDKKSHNHCIVASKKLNHRKIYTQSLCASKEANTRNCTYIPASLYYQINKDFKLATPHARFLPQKELKEEFRDFCIQSLNDKKDLFINDDIEPSVILSTLHHNNSSQCKRCKSAIDKKYLLAIRETRYGYKERLCPFCLPSYYRYYQCEKCGAYGTTDDYHNPLKFYPEIGVALSDDEKRNI